MATADLVIRDARADEHDDIRALTVKAYEQYASIMEPAAWEGLRAAMHNALGLDGAERIVAERGGRLVGSAMLFPPRSDAYAGATSQAGWPELRMLAVDPDARGHRIGEALVRECVRRARRMGATELGLHTSRSMAAAMHMYRRMGFVRAPEHDFQPQGAERVEGYVLRLDR
jgi:ribosomal protein S18 acetylase RimI-like enzyme